MKICIAQTSPIKGDIKKNLEKHVAFINESSQYKPDLIVFPELSLMGYEPEFAQREATTENDKRFDILQSLSNKNNIIICVGIPTKKEDKLYVSMIIFQPCKECITYSKQHLYHTETPIFTPAYNPTIVKFDNNNIIAPTICFELAVDQHQEYAHTNGATIYMTSVCNSVEGVDIDIKRLSDIAKKYNMTTVMSNFVGTCAGHKCGGKSSIWDNKGYLLAQLDGKSEGMILYNTDNKEYEYINI